MCGRYTLKTPNPRLQELFGLQDLPHLVPRFNIAPTQSVFAIRAADSAAALREGVMLRWGLIPFWAKDMATGNTMINARAETVAEKPSFRQAFLKRRCLIPADGFFEWEKLANGKKQPWWIRMKDEEAFAMAGLWESWSPKSETWAMESRVGDTGNTERESWSPKSKTGAMESRVGDTGNTDGQSLSPRVKPERTDEGQSSAQRTLQSCTILTINANADMQSLHDRMPVILPIEAWDAWLNPSTEKTALQALLKPFEDGHLIRSAVSTIVNRPTVDSPECIM